MSQGPLIVQSDRTVLLETDHADATTARHELAIFAELERAPEHIHRLRASIGLLKHSSGNNTVDPHNWSLETQVLRVPELRPSSRVKSTPREHNAVRNPHSDCHLQINIPKDFLPAWPGGFPQDD